MKFPSSSFAVVHINQNSCLFFWDLNEDEAKSTNFNDI